MDNYLDTLIRKGEQPLEEAVTSEIQEDVATEPEVIVPDTAVEDEETPEQEVSESIQSEEAENDKEPVEEPASETQPTKDKPKVSIVAEDSVAAVAKGSVKLTDTDENTVIPVKDIKIYNIPDKNSVFRLFTGNVTYLGKVSDMCQIRYMKYGFGLVIGYTDMLDVE